MRPSGSSEKQLEENIDRHIQAIDSLKSTLSVIFRDF